MPDGFSSDAFLSSATGNVPGVRFLHLTTAENTYSGYTLIDHYLTNENPAAIVFIAVAKGAAGAYSCEHTGTWSTIGVYYDATEEKWAIRSGYVPRSIPVGACFHVLVPDPTTNAFIHGTTVLNTQLNYTVVDHPLTNGQPDARLFVTPNWSPGGVSGERFANFLGVYYDDSLEKWIIFNQDYDSMPIGTAFNILVPEPDPGVFTLVTTVTNTWSSRVEIDHPLANHNPHALLFVTQGFHESTNNQQVGVVYWSWGSWYVDNLVGVTAPIGHPYNVLLPHSPAGAFGHRTTADGSSVTLIDHPLTNDDPHAIVFVTQNWNPGGGIGVYNEDTVGVYYNYVAGRWGIFNTPQTSTIPIDAAFNVLVPNVDAGVFVHRATADNILGHQTYIDHPLTNDNPDARLFAIQSFNPGGLGGEYNDHHIAVSYSEGVGKWAIINQDFGAMQPDTAFNVMMPIEDGTVFVHEATSETINSNWTYLDHPLINNNPDARVFVTQNWNPGGGFGIYNDHPIGVWYSQVYGKWAIYNQDREAMPEGASFNVLVMPGKVYLPLVLAD
jgi:hypothetical protein